MAPYTALRVWKAAHQLVVHVYRATENWPKREMYGLTAQTRRAAVSIAVNIAEGSVKRGEREFRRFLDMALGSVTELHYLIWLGHELGYLTRTDWETLESERNSAGKQLWALYAAVAKHAS